MDLAAEKELGDVGFRTQLKPIPADEVQFSDRAVHRNDGNFLEAMMISFAGNRLIFALALLMFTRLALGDSLVCKGETSLTGDSLASFQGLKSQVSSNDYFKFLQARSGAPVHCVADMLPSFASGKITFKFKDQNAFVISNDPDGGVESLAKLSLPIETTVALALLKKSFSEEKMCSINWNKPTVEKGTHRFPCLKNGKTQELGAALMTLDKKGKVISFGDAFDGLASQD